MSRTSDVFRLLVTANNKDVLAKDKKLTDLLPGQLGVFDASTHLSIDTTGKVPKEYYFAVGVDNNGDGVTDDIVKSTGNQIQGKNVFYYNYAKYSEGKPAKALLKDYFAQANKVYGIRVTLQNQAILQTQGYIPYSETYVVKNVICDNCADPCVKGDSIQVTKKLLLQINNDSNAFVTAKAVARTALTTATHGVTKAIGAELSIEDLDKMAAYNKTKTNPADFVHANIEFVTKPLKKIYDVCINIGYMISRETTISISLPEGFECDGKVEITQEAEFEQGAGYDLKQLEYIQKGWTESPYRTSALTGLPFPTAYSIDPRGKYDTFVFTYDEDTYTAFDNFKFQESTVIAVPTADATTVAKVKAMLEFLKG